MFFLGGFLVGAIVMLLLPRLIWVKKQFTLAVIDAVLNDLREKKILSGLDIKYVKTLVNTYINRINKGL
jgi:hypothetical protein